MQDVQWDSLYINGQIATMAGDQSPYGLLADAALAIKEGVIAWVGPMQSLLGEPERLAKTVYDLKGQCVTPGLIDCHTHLVYAGNRYYEFELRLQGATYETIARAGGGISSTVTATRMASFDDLW
jgi:imidazolonepropionase